jgi:hypothetical protein
VLAWVELAGGAESEGSGVADKVKATLAPRVDGVTIKELSEAVEDFCLGKAMDQGRETPLLDRDAALALLKS